jgi:hypothetical protein
MKIGPEGELKKVEENAKRGEDARQMLPPALLPAMDYGLWIDAYTGYVRFALLNVNMRSTVCLSTKGTDSISMRRNNRGRRMGTCIRVPLG